MSFDEYARHIKLKLGLATAVAVIKSKPDNLTIDEYIASLRNKLKADDPNPMDVDFELSLGSDEFDLMDEDSLQNGECDEVLTQTRESMESPTILRDFHPDDLILQNTSNQQLRSYSIDDDALSLLQGMDTDVSNNAVAVDMGQNFLRSMGNPTEAMPNDAQLTCLDNSTQMADKTNGIGENIAKFSSDTEAVGHNHVTKEKSPTFVSVLNIAQTLKENTNGNSVTDKPEEGKKRKIENVMQTQEIDTQETQIYSISDYTQNTHFSQSQIEDNRFVVLDKYLTSLCKPNQTTTEINTEIEINTKEIGKEMNAHDNNEIEDNTQIYLDMDLEIGKIEETKIARRKGRDIDIKTSKNTMENDAKTQEMQATKRENVPNTSLNLLNTDIQTSKDTVDVAKTQEVQAGIRVNSRNTSQNAQYTSQNDSDDELHDSQSETTIPFKIIEELNRVKSTLNRRNERKPSSDGFSTDSGYKSDSQTKSSYRSGLQTTGAWLNQSAHTLYDFLTRCPMAAGTAEITKEISQVLGELVDRMHSEENYPSFLDEVLGSIDASLDNLALGGCCGEQAMAEKDENIHRILLLNTSIHVITSTIEKITSKLELLHENITKEADICEITDIRAVENTAYVFHILEALLQRYVRKKAVLSSQPSSQASEDEKLPKRSLITEIWKQKWDPKFKRKDSVLNARSDVKCLDTTVGEVLNKIVIDCMEGYSLVSFAALQCFNVLQSQ